ncbi:MAG: hypothetical protein KDD82_31175 [Planctomycetes bacterium]|nr:hypothetical protein [Planctomycetota bacterium]
MDPAPASREPTADAPAEAAPAGPEEPVKAPGCGGCCLAIALFLVGMLLGYLDDRAQMNLDVYDAKRGQTFKIELHSDLETAKGLTRLHDLHAVLRLAGLPERELPCVSNGDSDFAELKEIDSVSYKGIPLNSINVDCTYDLAVEIPDDPALDGKQGELVFTARVQYYYVDFGDRIVGSATGKVPVKEKSADLDHAVPLRVVAPDTKLKKDRALKSASGIAILLAVLLGVISGIRFLIDVIRSPKPEEAAPPTESPAEA